MLKESNIEKMLRNTQRDLEECNKELNNESQYNNAVRTALTHYKFYLERNLDWLTERVKVPDEQEVF